MFKWTSRRDAYLVCMGALLGVIVAFAMALTIPVLASDNGKCVDVEVVYPPGSRGKEVYRAFENGVVQKLTNGEWESLEHNGPR